MDQTRLFLAIALSMLILLSFEWFTAKVHEARRVSQTSPRSWQITESSGVETAAPRVPIEGARIMGSINLRGARLDDVVLRDYRQTIDPRSPLVRLLAPRDNVQPYAAQFGWSSEDGSVKVPDDASLWEEDTADSANLTLAHPVALHWDNGAGLIFTVQFSIDENYLVTVDQSVRSSGGAPVLLHPWARIRRGYAASNKDADDGLVGVFDERVKNMAYKSAQAAADGIGFQTTSTGGWLGFNDKYWLTALMPDQKEQNQAHFRHLVEAGVDRYQVDLVGTGAERVSPGGEARAEFRLFVGAKELPLLDRYEAEFGIPKLDRAVNFGWSYAIAKPTFFAIEWLGRKLGNFGLAILAFTLGLKVLFFPLADFAARSAAKVKSLQPKLQELKTRLGDDQTALNQATLELYRQEKVNSFSGCLPMLVQLPVFAALYRDLSVSIELRQAPFFGWVHDLSAADPSNLFNLFGLLPFDPGNYWSLLHVGVWPLLAGLAMLWQQYMTPATIADPVQARMMRLMPFVYILMFARSPVGVMIYWSWSSLLGIAQQYWFLRRTTRPLPN